MAIGGNQGVKVETEGFQFQDEDGQVVHKLMQVLTDLRGQGEWEIPIGDMDGGTLVGEMVRCNHWGRGMVIDGIDGDWDDELEKPM